MDPFYLQQGNIFLVPVTHYNMEMASQVRRAFEGIKPDCVAVELPESLQLQILHAASRLPDVSVVVCSDSISPLYYLCEPCDASFEALRSALEASIPAWCIDLDVENYPSVQEPIPDPYAIHRVGLKSYYELYKAVAQRALSPRQDQARELYMARRLKELSFSHDRILFVCGMAHAHNILELMNNQAFPTIKSVQRERISVCTLTDSSCREGLAEFGWISTQYEKARSGSAEFPPDRQKMIYKLLKQAAENYTSNTGNSFPGYNFRNMMKFLRNYALIYGNLMPNLFQILSAARGCVDHNYAYEVWVLATEFGYLKNIDGLQALNLSPKELWGQSKIFRFQLKEKSKKGQFIDRYRNKQSTVRYFPPQPFGICSYPPEDITIERFGDFLKKKGTQILVDEASRTLPFSSSLEDGIDTKETIRHWFEKKLYVRVKGKPPGGVGSVVVIFDEDSSKEGESYESKYPWCTTWLGEHNQESDMAFYATPLGQNIVGPGISRCEYGGFMMSYPPRRMNDVWRDMDYEVCRSKSEVLLMAAIDYSIQPLITYVAAKPPKTIFKSFAKKFGKKIVFFPIGQLSPITLNKLRIFHVLDGHDKREIAGRYIYE